MRSKIGFTLLEILTVIAIIVILAGLLMPAIRRSRRIARKAECASNLRQIGIALQAYVNDPANNGNFPPAANWGVLLAVDNEGIFNCPSSSAGAGTAASPDYTYTAGLTDTSPSSTVIVRDTGTPHDGVAAGVANQLRVDGSVFSQ
jgi:prepilin-type N-terminal cleavage/methylation domain-containing protein